MKHTLGIALLALTAPVMAQAQRVQASSEWAITPELETAVERGLRWLADHQDPDGYWAQDIGFKLNVDYSVTDYDTAHVGVGSRHQERLEPSRGLEGDLPRVGAPQRVRRRPDARP